MALLTSTRENRTFWMSFLGSILLVTSFSCKFLKDLGRLLLLRMGKVGLGVIDDCLASYCATVIEGLTRLFRDIYGVLFPYCSVELVIRLLFDLG